VYEEHPASFADDDDAIVPAPPRRRLRVRYSYPKPLVELVVALLHYHDPKTLAALLDIPLSSVYRWRAEHNTTRASDGADVKSMQALLDRCGDIGFHVPRSVLFENDGVVKMTRRSPEEGAGHTSTQRANKLPIDVCRTERNERPSRGVRDRIEAVRQLIDREYFRDLDSRTLAQTACMSRHHFIRTFNSWIGTPPHQYLMRVRIDAAKRLLGSSSQSIDVVAAATGFRSASCLNRTFRRMEGNSVSRSFGILRRAASERT
jgi:AraC-like DNA-binding protein